jgi:hypothetical protein
MVWCDMTDSEDLSVDWSDIPPDPLTDEQALVRGEVDRFNLVELKLYRRLLIARSEMEDNEIFNDFIDYSYQFIKDKQDNRRKIFVSNVIKTAGLFANHNEFDSMIQLVYGMDGAVCKSVSKKMGKRINLLAQSETLSSSRSTPSTTGSPTIKTL